MLLLTLFEIEKRASVLNWETRFSDSLCGVCSQNLSEERHFVCVCYPCHTFIVHSITAIKVSCSPFIWVVHTTLCLSGGPNYNAVRARMLWSWWCFIIGHASQTVAQHVALVQCILFAGLSHPVETSVVFVLTVVGSTPCTQVGLSLPS